MKNTVALVLAVACFCGWAVAQQGAPAVNAGATEKPAKYVYYEDVKVTSGRMRQFVQETGQIRQAASSASSDAYWFAGSHVTGDGNDVVFVTFQPTMAAVEKFDENISKVASAAMTKNASLAEQSGASQAGANLGLAEYSDELALRPELVPPGSMHFWQTTAYQLRPGCSDEFKDVVKQVAEMHKKADDNAHWLAYEVLAGGQVPTFLLVRPMKSLAEQDEEPPAAAKEMFQARPFQHMTSAFSKECVAHVERNIYKVEPGLSRPAQSMVAASPEFWNVKEENASAVAPKKGKAVKAKGPVKGQ
jgi:hypothetical protein